MKFKALARSNKFSEISPTSLGKSFWQAAENGRLDIVRALMAGHRTLKD